MTEKPLNGIKFPGLSDTYRVVPLGMFTREIRVDSSNNTGGVWDQLKLMFAEMNMGTVEYVRVAIAQKYAEESYLPGGGYMAQLVKIGGNDNDHPYGFIRLTSYWSDGFGLPQEYTCRCEGDLTEWKEIKSLSGVLSDIIEAQSTYTAMMTNSLEV
jgi:hypothetical protein